MKTRFKQVVTLFLVFVLVVLPGFGAGVSAQGDDLEGHWAEDEVRDWRDRALIEGYSDGTFRPDNGTTRAEFMALVNRSNEFDNQAAITYDDVDEDDWYYETVARAEAVGYITGYTDNTMRPDQPISRQEAAVMILRLADLDDEGEPDFTDAADIPDWSAGAIASAVEEELMNGYPDGSFRPENDITRAETVVTLQRLLDFPATYPVTFAETNELKDVSITVDGEEAVVTDAGGEAVIELEDGNFDFTATLESHEAYTGSLAVDGEAKTVAFEMMETAVVTELTVSGAAAINIPVDGDVSESYIATVNDQYGEEMQGESVHWSVDEPSTGVSVDEAGIVTVTEEAEEGDVTVTATADEDRDVRGQIEVAMTSALSAPPENVEASAHDASINLSWDAVADAKSYTVYQSTERDSGYKEIGGGFSESGYTAENLTPGTRYYFKVTAITASAESEGSEVVTAVANVDDHGDVFYGDRLLISHEDPNHTNSQSTGGLPDKSIGISTNEDGSGTEQESFRVNPVLPFEPGPDDEAVEADSLRVFSDEPETGTMDDFYVDNFETSDGREELAAELKYLGDHVEVWVESDDPTVEITSDMAQEMGEEFDDQIYGLITENFYDAPDVSGDGRITILVFDIQDGFGSGDSSFVGGYFWGGDLFEGNDSNEREIFYVDTYPSMGLDADDPDVTNVFSTIAHEFQHMVNFNRNFLENDEKREQMDLWLDEALSLAAEHMYQGVQTNRLNWYNQSDAIENGRSLLDWNSDEVLANYSLSYLFSQYLRTQIELAHGSDHDIPFFREIIEDDARDYEAVENVIQNHLDPDVSFGEFMTRFRAATLLKADTGPYGFGGEADFDDLSTPLYSGDATDLDGGGAIVVELAEPFTDPKDSGSNVNYRGIFTGND